MKFKLNFFQQYFYPFFFRTACSTRQGKSKAKENMNNTVRQQCFLIGL